MKVPFVFFYENYIIFWFLFHFHMILDYKKQVAPYKLQCAS